MNYASIKWCDSGNGPGARVVLFVSGCNRHCPGCFNQETWDFNYGEKFSTGVILKIVDWLNGHKYMDGVTILGGEPLESKNVHYVATLIDYIKRYCPGKTIWLYTGFTYEELIDRGNTTVKSIAASTDYILNNIDVLVDGPFIINQKNIALNFRGSSNQRIIDMNETRKNNELTLSKYNN